MRSNDRKILIGKLGKPHGVKGYLYLHYYGDDLSVLDSYESLSLKNSEFLSIEKMFTKGDRLIIKFNEFNDRDSVEFLRNEELFILEGDLPALEDGETYLYQLEGMIVKNLENQVLGKVKGTFGTKSNEVLIVESSYESIDDKERLLPYVKPDVVKDVDLVNKIITVEWLESY